MRVIGPSSYALVTVYRASNSSAYHAEPGYEQDQMLVCINYPIGFHRHPDRSACGSEKPFPLHEEFWHHNDSPTWYDSTVIEV